jgi:cold shock CspA family protein
MTGGSVSSSQGGSEVFVHISALPKDGRRPAIGWRLTFEIEVDGFRRKPRRCCRDDYLRIHRHVADRRRARLQRITAQILGAGGTAQKAPSRPNLSRGSFSRVTRDLG